MKDANKWLQQMFSHWNKDTQVEAIIRAIQDDAAADMRERAAKSLEADLGHETWAEGLPLPPQELKWVEHIRALPLEER